MPIDRSASIKVHNSFTDGRSAGIRKNKAVDTVGDTFASDTAEDFVRSPNKKPNVLHKYSSFNSIFTLSVLTVKEINDPKTFRAKGSPDYIILKSGGASDKYKTSYDDKGAREFLITDMEIKTTISPNPKTKHTNAYSIQFKVIEPYSLGLFLETLRQVCKKVGHKNYTSAPYCLTIDFIGYDSEGKIASVENSRRVIPIKINQVDFEANQNGSVYNVQAIAWNEQALNGGIQTLSTDITIKGSTVQEMLQVSLQKEINAIKASKNKDKNELNHQYDDYIINFPKEDQAITIEQENKSDADEQRTLLVGTGTPVRTTKEDIFYKQDKKSLNDIGAMKMIVNKNQIEEVVNSPLFNQQKKLVDITQIVKEWKKGKLIFKAGTNIEHIITNVIIFSELAEKSFKSTDTFKQWFRIHTRTYIIQDEKIYKKRGKYPLLYVYDVMPYRVHASVFARPDKALDVIPIEKLIVKEYDYIYTGKNLDILDFQIKINFAFTATLPMDQARSKTGDDDRDRDLGNNTNPIQQDESEVEAEQFVAGTLANGVVRRQFANYEAISGLTPEQRLSLEFNEAIIYSTADLTVVDITILGDPYYIADDGMGNYNSAPTAETNYLNKDGGIHPTFDGVYIAINFRTPIDVSQEGAIFRDASNTGESFQPVPAFSGVYRINMVDNVFQNGVFKQILNLTRVVNQEVKKKSTNTNALSAMHKEIEQNFKAQEGFGASP